MVDLSEFLTRGGTRINFRRLAEVSVGTVVGAILSGIASVVLGLVDVPVALLGGLASFAGAVVEVLAGLPAAIIERGFIGASEFVLDAGIAGFVVAIVIALATIYSVSWVMSRVV